MENLITQSQSGKDVTTSLIIAKVFGKEHAKVIRDIENLNCSDEFRVANFGEATFTNEKTGQLHRMYEITKDGFSFLVMGYNGDKAGEFKEKFIYEFNKRESLLRNDDFIVQRALFILTDRVKMIETENNRLACINQLLEGEIQKVVPKVEYYDSVLQSKSEININQIAKELGMSAIALNRKLAELKVQYKQRDQWLLFAKYQNKGFTQTETFPFRAADGTIKTCMRTVWTEQGRVFIHSLIKQKSFAW